MLRPRPTPGLPRPSHRPLAHVMPQPAPQRPIGRLPCLARSVVLSALLAVPTACAPITRPTTEPIDLFLRTSADEPLRIDGLRGQPLLLVLFATYDSASQLLWTPLALARSQHPELRVVGIALQPDAQALLPMYGQSLGIEIPLASDPAQSILPGDSDLGPIAAIPELILLDEDGHVIARRSGGLTPEALREWLDTHL